MSRLYYTHEARMSKIEEIKKQIETLGHLPNGELSYLDYRAITQNLNMLKDAIEYEDRQEENKVLDKAIWKTAKAKG